MKEITQGGGHWQRNGEWIQDRYGRLYQACYTSLVESYPDNCVVAKFIIKPKTTAIGADMNIEL